MLRQDPAEGSTEISQPERAHRSEVQSYFGEHLRQLRRGDVEDDAVAGSGSGRQRGGPRGSVNRLVQTCGKSASPLQLR